MNKLKFVSKFISKKKLIFPTYKPLKPQLGAPKGGFIESSRPDTVKVNKEKNKK